MSESDYMYDRAWEGLAMTEKRQQQNIVDEMMKEYSCIFYPLCHKARELLYCPQKVGKSKCDDYRQYLTPALTAYYTGRSRDTGKPISSLVLQDLAALHRKRMAREEKRVFRDIEYERL
jgi:hypothetical protein